MPCRNLAFCMHLLRCTNGANYDPSLPAICMPSMQREITMIRCDDIFVDNDVNQFKKIMQMIRRYGFDHLIGITPLGEGKKLWAHRMLWKTHFLCASKTKFGFFINYHLKKITGEKYIGNNAELVRTLDTEFNKYKAIPALHGLHHYKYDNLPENKVYKELSTGIKIFKELFNLSVEIFTPPFNVWNHKTELVCKSLNLCVDKCRTSFDFLIRDMNDSQIKQLAKQQSSVPEVSYHPFRLVSLNKFELYLKIRRKYC